MTSLLTFSLLYCVQQIELIYVAVCLFSNRSQNMSKCGGNDSVTQLLNGSCATFYVLKLTTF